jgi:hypothetical protein
MVQLGARLIGELNAETVFASDNKHSEFVFANNKDSEFTLEDFNHWLGMYRDAAALGEAILVKLA